MNPGHAMERVPRFSAVLVIDARRAVEDEVQQQAPKTMSNNADTTSHGIIHCSPRLGSTQWPHRLSRRCVTLTRNPSLKPSAIMTGTTVSSRTSI